MTEQGPLSETIASTATIKLATIPESNFFCTPIEERFERLTRLTQRSINVPVAAVTFISADRQWFKSVVGWAVTELPYAQSLCMTTMSAGALTVIEDTRKDDRAANLPHVEGSPHFRFYAGCPLKDENDVLIGTFCVFDTKPRKFSAADRETFHDLTLLVQRELFSENLHGMYSALASKLGLARREAMMDPLTRLWNRRGAAVMLKSAIENADREDAPLAIAVLDLDNFKRVNDSYGHQIGDEVLRKTASRLVRSVRVMDVVCRVGGDEFLVLMADADSKSAQSIAERVRSGVTQTSIPTRQGRIPMSISLGYTVRDANEPISVDELFERADRALLQAKGAGRDRVSLAD